MECFNLSTITGKKRGTDGRNLFYGVYSHHRQQMIQDPYNVFRPREKAHRLHTRWMQRRENNLQSFEKLRQVMRNLEQTKTIMQTLLLREENKRDVVESEITLQRIQLKYKNETQLLEDSLALPGLPSFPSKVSSEEEFVDSDDVVNSALQMRPLLARGMPIPDSKQPLDSITSVVATS